MYGLEVGTDVSALVGCRLESLDLTPHLVQLRFDTAHNVVLSIESDFAVGPRGQAVTTYDDPPAAARVLADLFDLVVVGAAVEESGTLTIRWEDGTTTRVMDSNEHHESYQLHLGRRVVVV